MTVHTFPKGLLFSGAILVSALILPLTLSCNPSDNNAPLRSEIVLPQNDLTIRERESVLFKAAAIGGTPPYRYYWNFGPVAPETAGQYTPEIQFRFEGAYMAILTVIDSQQRKATDSVKILVIKDETLSNDSGI